MKESRIGSLIVLIALVIMMNTAMVWGQSKDITIADGPLREEVIAGIKEMSSGCSPFARPEYRDWNAVNEQRPSANGVMVAEDMRCRQCRGKCAAESLRCRSQCVGDPACLDRCQERTDKCEAMCKQVFQCE